MKSRMQSYAEFKLLLGDEKRQSDPVFCRYIIRPLSFPIGWILYKFGLTANSISLISIFLAILASALIVNGNTDDVITASLLMLTVALTDCIDGNVARARQESGPGGEWMDALSGYTVYALLPFALGIHIHLSDPHTSYYGTWIIVGASTSVSNLYLRLLYQKFIVSIGEKSVNSDIKGRNSLFSKLSSELGLVGWMMPAFVFAATLGILKVYLAVYSLFYGLSAVVVAIFLARRIVKQ